MANAESEVEDAEAEDDPRDSADDKQLAEKYEKLQRQIFPQKIELPISTLDVMEKNQIELAPGFQRRNVWRTDKQSKFIESLIMNVPVPPVFMGEDSYGKYVVLDGRQRLTAILKFLKNEFALKNLKVWKELNGDRFTDLKDKGLDAGLTRRFLPAVVLLKESSPEVKYDVFERLNTGGMNLNAMEIRNAVYRGKFTDLLHECSVNKRFRVLWGIPTNKREREKHNTYARMQDLELVLRFFALSAAQEHGAKRPAFKTYLGAFMSKRNEQYDADESLFRKDKATFERAIANCYNFLGENAFVRPNGSRSAPLGDALMYALMDVDPAIASSEQAKDAVRASVQNLKEDVTFLRTMDQGTNGRAKIDQRLRMAHHAVKSALADSGVNGAGRST